jgi:hypothetical protein
MVSYSNKHVGSVFIFDIPIVDIFHVMIFNDLSSLRVNSFIFVFIIFNVILYLPSLVI